MSVCHTINTNSPYVCQPHDMSVHHTNMMSSPSVCPSYQLSDHHTTTMACLSVCQSNQLSDCHTVTKTSLSLCQSCILSVCHNVIPMSPSVCQLQDLSVCQPPHDVIIPPIWLIVCLSSAMSILPSANSMVKIPMSIPVQKFPHTQNPGKLPFIRTSMNLSVHHTGSLSISLSLSAANLLKINPLQLWGEKCSKLSAQKPGKITNCQYIVCYAFWCTCPCIVHTIHPYIVRYVCQCTHPCIAHTTHLYIMCYICHCTHLCIAHSICPSL